MTVTSSELVKISIKNRHVDELTLSELKNIDDKLLDAAHKGRFSIEYRLTSCTTIATELSRAFIQKIVYCDIIKDLEKRKFTVFYCKNTIDKYLFLEISWTPPKLEEIDIEYDKFLESHIKN